MQALSLARARAAVNRRQAPTARVAKVKRASILFRRVAVALTRRYAPFEMQSSVSSEAHFFALFWACALAACSPGAPPDRATSPVTPTAPGAGTAPVGTPGPSAPTPPQATSATLQALADHQRLLQSHLEAARARMSQRDGTGCLAELDAYDRIEPRMTEPTTSKASPYAPFRGQCLMLAGQCAAGKTLFRDSLEHSSGATMGPDTRERSIDAIVGLYCQGPNLTDRDKLIRASMALTDGAYMNRRTSAFCQENASILKDVIPKVAPAHPGDAQVVNAPDSLRNAGTTCFAKADDCAGAWAFYQDIYPRIDLYRYSTPDRQEMMRKAAAAPPSVVRRSFEAMNRSCAPPP